MLWGKVISTIIFGRTKQSSKELFENNYFLWEDLQSAFILFNSFIGNGIGGLILDEFAHISLHTNALGKGMNPSVFSAGMSRK